MSETENTQQISAVLRTALIIRSIQGFVIGLSLYTWGPLFYEQLVKTTIPSTAVTLTTVLFSIEFILVTLLEVPTGAFADTIGRKWSVVCSMFAITINYLLLSILPFLHSFVATLVLGVMAIFFFALSYTFFSGSFTAWCVDALRRCAPDMRYEHVLAPAQTASSLLMMVGSVVGILLYAVSYASLAFFVGAILSSLSIIYCVAEIHDDVSTHHSVDMTKLASITTEMGRIVGVAIQSFRTSTVIATLVLISACYLAVNNFVSMLWPIYVRSHFPGSSQVIIWIAVAVIMQLAEAVGSLILGKWSKRKNHTRHMSNIFLRRLLIGMCLLCSTAVIAESFVTWRGYDMLWLFVLSVVLVAMAYGLIIPTIETLMNNHISDSSAKQRATILSLPGFFRGILVLLMAAPTSGPSGDKTMIGWAVPAALLLIVALRGNFVLKREEAKAPLLHAQENLSPTH